MSQRSLKGDLKIFWFKWKLKYNLSKFADAVKVCRGRLYYCMHMPEKKKKRSKINNISFHHGKLEKEEKINST